MFMTVVERLNYNGLTKNLTVKIITGSRGPKGGKPHHDLSSLHKGNADCMLSGQHALAGQLQCTTRR